MAVALDVGAALLSSKLSLRAWIELTMITLFVNVGMRIVPLVEALNLKLRHPRKKYKCEKEASGND